MTKRLITWKRKKINQFCYKDPCTDDRVNKETGGITTFTETPYCIADGRFISLVEYPDGYTEENVKYFKNLDPDFEFTFVTEAEANTLLNGCFNGLVTVSNFEFTDNRPQDILGNI